MLLGNLYVSFGKISIYIPAHLVIGLFGGCSPLLNCINSSYILDINPLSDMWFENIFSQSIDCLFILLIASFAVQNPFNLIESYYFFLLLLPSFTLGVKFKKPSTSPLSVSFPSCFLQGSS